MTGSRERFAREGILCCAAILVLLALCGCAGSRYASFRDANLEAGLRRNLEHHGILAGDESSNSRLEKADLALLTKAVVSGMDESNRISSLQGLDVCENLQDLVLTFHPLDAQSLRVLGRLPKLRSLVLDATLVRDLDALVDILVELPNLQTLAVGNNQITDISSLVRLQQITWLWLYHNDITDISPLLEMPNLRDVRTYGNPLDESPDSNATRVIETLKSRGVTVQDSRFP